MNSRAILGVSLAAVFALSMIMLPAYAGGHLAIVNSEMIRYLDKGEIDLSINVAAKIPKSETGLFGWALLGWNSVLVLVTHVPAFDDSAFDNKGGAFHTHVLDLIPSTACTSGTEIDTSAAITDPGYINKVGSDNIKIKKVPLSDLNGKTLGAPIEVAGFAITSEGDSLCINIKSISTPDITLKN